jgi:hypothetical protein
MLLLKIQGLSYGYSGVQLETVERLIYFFNNDLFPVVYTQGSLGASGDLAPLAHLCLPLLGMGEFHFKDEEPLFYLELKTNKKIHDFESIEHPVHTFLAASPDGIDDDGIMKEIKNPRVREIIGVPKPEYWVQTQIQMACCDLNACDFIESYITEYACKEYYGEDYTEKLKEGLLNRYKQVPFTQETKNKISIKKLHKK